MRHTKRLLYHQTVLEQPLFHICLIYVTYSGYHIYRVLFSSSKMIFCKLHVLYEFQCTNIVIVLVTNSHVINIERTTLFFKPYSYIVAITFTEGINDTTYDWLYLWRMAGIHIATNSCRRAFEDLFTIVEVTVNVFVINEGYFHWHCIKHGI